MATLRPRITGLILGGIGIGLLVSIGQLGPTAILDGLGALLYALYPIVLLVLFVLLARRLLSSLE